MEKLDNIEISEVCEMLVNNINDLGDSVVQMGIDDGHLYSCILQKNETENPLNKVVEIYRLDSNINWSDMCVCTDCPNYEKIVDEDMMMDCVYDSVYQHLYDNWDSILKNVERQMENFE